MWEKQSKIEEWITWLGNSFPDQQERQDNVAVFSYMAGAKVLNKCQTYCLPFVSCYHKDRSLDWLKFLGLQMVPFGL